MNKTAIKNYAIWARVNLIEAAKQRAYQYEITKDSISDANADVVSGKPLTKEEKEQRRQLIDQINRKGFDQVMEEVAYTWFNRFIALRFMEVNGYLPTKIRVFTDAEGNFKPEILKEALSVELPVDKSRVMELLEKQDNEELYKMLLIAQCNELSNGLPDMFEVISNYTELLFPNNLLKEDSVLGEMVNTIPEEDWTDAVQIIGWLYQYYNSELKDETFALLKKNVKISKERIPAATQLFTPDWIVRYMVENSLGRLWYEGHPNDEIKKEWKYYLDEAQQEPEVEEQLKVIREEYKAIKPEDIKVIDPCMGSGHILVYAFDVLMQIYSSAGWSERDAAESILENNLYGLDIDDRAGQLAYFAVMMKARKYSRRILTKNIRPKVYSIQESNNVKIEAWWRLGPEEDIARRLVDGLTDAKTYGSIINLSVITEELKALRKRLDDIEEMSDMGNLLDVIQSDEITRQLYPLIDIAEVMVQKYDVVVTNPPYMGAGNMSAKLSDYVKEYYPDSKADLFAVFIEKCGLMTKSNGYQAMITQQAWMFIGTYERLRIELLKKYIISLVHFGIKAFEEIGNDIVQTCSFVINSRNLPKYKSLFIRLVDYKEYKLKETEFFCPENRYVNACNSLRNIPGIPLAYWVSNNFSNAFNNSFLNDYGVTRKGMYTGLNEVYVKSWQEVEFDKIAFLSSKLESELSNLKWYPYSNGGEYRKWYGNYFDVVDWQHNGLRLRNERNDKGAIRAGCFNMDYIFNIGITWTSITSSRNSMRLLPDYSLFSSASNSWFGSNPYYVLGYLNSVVSMNFLKILNPTLNANPGDVGRIPILFDSEDVVINNCMNNIGLSRLDWDSYETSWDFKKNPLI